MLSEVHSQRLIRTDIHSNLVPGMSEERQVDFYTKVGLLACRSAGMSELDKSETTFLVRNCLSCNLGSSLRWGLALWDDDGGSILEDSMTTLLQLPQAQKSRRTKVAAMNAVRRLLAHTANLSALCISTSIFGQWCMQALRSSTRQLRIAAGYVFVPRCMIM